jgi:protein-disulfide isomerase
VALPIGLGLLLLLGAVVGGAVFMSRRPPAAATASTGPAIATPIAPVAPGAPPPRLALPSAEPDEPALVTLPTPSVGERARNAEAHALLPLTPAAPIWGTADALVTLQVFGDLECPHTRKTLGSAVRMASRFGERLRLVYSHRPLSRRPLGLDAARAIAGLALRSPDASWRALAEAAGGVDSPEPSEVERWFSRAGVDADPRKLSASPEAHARVEQDRLLAVALDVQLTPTLFVNGRRIIGETPDSLLEAAIENEARAVRWLRAEGVSSEDGYVRRVRRNLIGVEGGAPDRACVPSEAAPSSGPQEAPLTIVEFSDFQCTHCRLLEPILTRVLARHGGQVRRVWRSFVVSAQGRGDAIAAFALATRDLFGERAFWSLHAALNAIADGDFSDERLRAVAAKLGLDGTRIIEAAGAPSHLRALARDHELAESLGLDGAPTLFINGREIAGAVPAERLEAVIKEELAAARRITHGQNGGPSLQSLLCGG